VRSCEVSRSAPDARRDGGKIALSPQGDFRTEIAILVRKSPRRARCLAGSSGGPSADSFRPEPGVGAIGRGRNESASEAKQVGRGELIRSLSEGGRGKDSPPALPERRMQMSAIRAQVRHGEPGRSIHRDKDRRYDGRESRSVGLVPCFHSMSVETPSESWS
jgi:hypothetical protein